MKNKTKKSIALIASYLGFATIFGIGSSFIINGALADAPANDKGITLEILGFLLLIPPVKRALAKFAEIASESGKCNYEDVVMVVVITIVIIGLVWQYSIFP